jgi:diguanylate cyclase (GGDEF)-like protein
MINFGKKTVIALSSIWSAIIFFSIYYNYLDLEMEHKERLRTSANSYFKQLVLMRDWNFLHKSVYVPVTDKTQPNIYLIDEKRDIDVDKEFKLTQIDAAYMTKELSNLSFDKDGIKFRITSLTPIKPENSPTNMEKEALNSFKDGDKEFIKFFDRDKKEYFFYMAPLITEKRCLSCHVEWGYKEGDIRGGISIVLPNNKGYSLIIIIISHLLIWAIGLAGIVYFSLKLRTAYSKLKEQATIDPLTQIANRRSFMERFELETKLQNRKKYDLTIIMCDVDNFKKYNDTYGHSKGDECLKAVADSIKKSIRRPTDICARYGGEEFIILLPDTPIDGAKIVAQNICDSVRKLAISHEKNLPSRVVTISLGIACRNDSEDYSNKQLIENADKALYLAKTNGRDKFEVFEN